MEFYFINPDDIIPLPEEAYIPPTNRKELRTFNGRYLERKEFYYKINSIVETKKKAQKKSKQELEELLKRDRKRQKRKKRIAAWDIFLGFLFYPIMAFPVCFRWLAHRGWYLILVVAVVFGNLVGQGFSGDSEGFNAIGMFGGMIAVFISIWLFAEAQTIIGVYCLFPGLVKYPLKPQLKYFDIGNEEKFEQIRESIEREDVELKRYTDKLIMLEQEVDRLQLIMKEGKRRFGPV